MKARLLGTIAILWLVVAATARPSGAQPPSTPAEQGAEGRAVAFLTREVPRWKTENDCYSCHNNGDAARALIAAGANGYDVGPALDDTLTWLRNPGGWDKNKTTGGIDDKPLARVQFASALARAVAADRASNTALGVAADILIRDQKDDGSWQLDTSKSLGSPTTYGTALATATARRSLAAVPQPGTGVVAALRKADEWLRAAPVESVLDAAAIALGLERATDALAVAQRDRALTTIAKGQSRDGGWGPYTSVAPQVFDTALVLLALTELRGGRPAQGVFTSDALTTAVDRGRAYLLSQQLPDGSWPETTRPANQESYAQRISTTGWALLALLATSAK